MSIFSSTNTFLKNQFMLLSSRMFAVIGNNADIGRDVCINRSLDGLPALMLQIPAVGKVIKLLFCDFIHKNDIKRY